MTKWQQTESNLWEQQAQTQGDVYNAFNATGQHNVRDLYTTRNNAVNQDRLRRGMLFGSSGGDTSMADLVTWRETQQAKERANALIQSLQAGQSLRGEAGKNWWDMLNFVGNTDQAAKFGDIANQYGQIGANQMSGFGSFLSAAAQLYGAIK